ncbi:MAG: protoglobin domain-containing protein [Gammaproteobacteria bacterium]
MTQDFIKLAGYAKSLTGLKPEYEALLKDIGPKIQPHLKSVTEDFYRQLLEVPEAKAFIEDRVDFLKTTHIRWLGGLFTEALDAGYASHLYHVGSVHVKVDLPVEFMSGGMTLINDRLFALAVELFGDDQAYCSNVLAALNAVTGFSLFIMQQSYQEASLAEELEKFLKITGMSKVLFKNLADAYKD